ncbi:MAG: 3-methyladenine DNA glycosylase [Akkermansiaceae bacterium]
MTADTASPFHAQRLRAEKFTVPYRRRRAARKTHPVSDFLFIYYPFPPSQLERWHPGPNNTAEIRDEDASHLRTDHYHLDEETARLAPEKMPTKVRERLKRVHNLLTLTQSRAANFSCAGMHEWAMVYSGADVRHRESAPLRFPQNEIDRIVESLPITCSHFDAFRFFSPDAIKFNRLQPTLGTREQHEQPACLHANMDLYKWASKAMPWVGTDVLWQCFLLALKARELDMRASPYDLTTFGYSPIKIETSEGRGEYEQQQRMIATEAKQLRARLIDALAVVITTSDVVGH